MLMLVITDTSGTTMFVASPVPPMPVSITAYSTPHLANHRNAVTVSISKYVHPMPSSARFTSSSSESICSEVMSTPSTEMLSVLSSRKGDVNSPVLIPDALKMESIIAQTDPFPSEPATCIALNNF